MNVLQMVLDYDDTFTHSILIYSNGPGDGGIDIVVCHNGVDYAIQCKKYEDGIGN